MKRILFFQLFSFLLCASVIAQLSPVITTANGRSIGDAFLVNDVISLKDHGFLVLQSRVLDGYSEVDLQVFDLTRTLTNSETLTIGQESGELRLQGVTEWHNTVLVFLSLYKEETKKNGLFVYQYNLPDLSLKKAFQIDEAYNPYNFIIPFLYDISPDESKMVFTSWSYSLPKDPARLTVKVFDTDFNEIQEKRYISPYENRKFYISDTAIDDAGNTYIIGKKHTGNNYLDYYSMNGIRGDKFILAFFQDQKSPNIYEIEVKKHNFPLLKFQIDPQQNLVGLGLYRIGARKSYAGTCTFKLNPSTKELKMNNQTIDKATFKEALGEVQPDLQGSTTFENALINNIILKDNAYYLVGERIKTEQVTTSSLGQFQPYGPTTDYDNHQTYSSIAGYSLLDIFLIKLNLKGNFQWMKRIPKRQMIDGDSYPYFSFNVLDRDHDILLFYNDHPENLKIQPKKKLKDSDLKSSVPTLAIVRCSNGAIRKRKLTSLFGKQALIRPTFCKKIDKEKVFMYGQSKKMYFTTYRMKVANLGGNWKG